MVEPVHAHFKKLINYLQHVIAPLNLAESWDNVGLLLEASSLPKNINVMLTNDYSEPVLEECICKNVGLVISYHPLIFSPLKSLSINNWKERVILKSIQNGISVYSPHTSLDCCKDGSKDFAFYLFVLVNDWLAKAFVTSACTITPLRPCKMATCPEEGIGRLVTLDKSISCEKAVELIKLHLNLHHCKLEKVVSFYLRL